MFDQRLVEVASRCTGFIYAASLMGVTGARSQISNAAEGLVERIRKVTKTPICVGLGVSNADQARDVARFADGVIVGSAFINAVNAASDLAAGLVAVTRLAQELKAGIK